MLVFSFYFFSYFLLTLLSCHFAPFPWAAGLRLPIESTHSFSPPPPLLPAWPPTTALPLSVAPSDGAPLPLRPCPALLSPHCLSQSPSPTIVYGRSSIFSSATSSTCEEGGGAAMRVPRPQGHRRPPRVRRKSELMKATSFSAPPSLSLSRVFLETIDIYHGPTCH
jgi:hypothetical protein